MKFVNMPGIFKMGCCTKKCSKTSVAAKKAYYNDDMVGKGNFLLHFR